jgi:hypothetical protein
MARIVAVLAILGHPDEALDLAWRISLDRTFQKARAGRHRPPRVARAQRGSVDRWIVMRLSP